MAGAQTQVTEGASLPQRGNEKYWLVVDEFADVAIHFRMRNASPNFTKRRSRAASAKSTGE
jgi:hypothetical protein